MIEATATVVTRDAGRAVVEAARQSACDGCGAAAAGCGTGVLRGLLGRRPVRLAVPLSEPVEVGDRVVIGIAEETLLRGAAWVYAVPLLAMLAGGGLGEALGGATGMAPEPFAVLAAVAGLLGGLRLARRRLAGDAALGSARLLGRAPATDPLSPEENLTT